MADPFPPPSIAHEEHGPNSAFGLLFGLDCNSSPVSMGYQQSEHYVENDMPNESNDSTHLMDENSFFGQKNEPVVENDIPNENHGNNCGINLMADNTFLRPVLPGESGEGLPYAPVDWPNLGDVWSWRVGKRFTTSGYFQDRFLYAPKHLQKGGRHLLGSKPAVENFIRSEFPGADIDALFASFSWRIPVKMPSPTPTKEEAAPPPAEDSQQGGTEKGEEVKEELPLYARRQRKPVVPTLTEIIGEQKVTPRSSKRQRKQRDLIPSSSTPSSTAKRKTRGTSKQSVTFNEDMGFEGEPVVDLIPEDFDNYLKSLEDIVNQPLSATPPSHSQPIGSPITEDEMAKARIKLSSLLTMDFPTLISSRNVNKVTNLASKLRKDPNLTAEQLVKLKLIEEIHSFSEVFLGSKDSIEQVNEFFTGLESNKNKVSSLKSEYNELKEKADQLQTQVDSNLLTVQEIDNQINQLKNWRAELVNTIESNKAAKNEVTTAQKMVANVIPAVVHEIQVANSKIPEWELKRTNALKRESEILEKFAPLNGFSL